MNKINNFFVLGILMNVFLFFACKESPGSGKANDFHLTLADTILDQYNAQRPSWDWSVITKGNVNIITSDGMISIEHDPEHGEQLVTYFLQTEKKERNLKKGEFGRAEVLFLDRNLIVNSLERDKTLLFSIEADQDPSYLKGLKNVKQYKGIGLGLRKINKNSVSKSVPFCSCEVAGSPESICSSGGYNALSCSSTNNEGTCRVSCSGQRFACCDKKMN